MNDTSFYELVQDRTYDNLISDIGPTNYPSHFHKKTEITYMKNGNCLSVINNEKYFAEKDYILFIPEYYPHSYDTSPDAERLVILPTQELKNDFTALADTKTFFCLLSDKDFNRQKILPILTDMLKVQEDGSIEKRARFLLLKGYTTTFYGRLFEQYAHLLISRKKQIESLTAILAYLDEHYAENITLDMLAQQFRYNKFYFSKLFNSCVNDNLKNYVNGIRIKKFVETYSLDPAQNITRLALDLGFESMPSFYRAFKRIYHCCPKEYFASPVFEKQ